MTRDQIMALAGREFDIAVAEATGWRWMERDGLAAIFCPHVFDPTSVLGPRWKPSTAAAKRYADWDKINGLPDFTEPSADYGVLVWVRSIKNEWGYVQRGSFREHLLTLWQERSKAEHHWSLGWNNNDFDQYHPGDYGRALLLSKAGAA